MFQPVISIVVYTFALRSTILLQKQCEKVNFAADRNTMV